VIKEAPTDFAVRLYLCVNLFSDNPNPDLFWSLRIILQAYAAAQKAKKDAAAASSGRCAEKLLDAKGRCPGDTGYVPLIKEAPVDFAVSFSYFGSDTSRIAYGTL
jgi:hypothetical protein